MSAAADLLRAADGASLPRRKPMAEREAPPPPQVIVQQVAPPMAYDEPDDDSDDSESEPEPAKPPAWTDKLGDVFTELAPMAKMMLQNKLADLVAGGGGGDLGGLGAIFGGMMPGTANGEPRNAAPVPSPIPEPPLEEQEIDPTPEALELLGRVIERLSGERAGRALRDELRLMEPDARVAFALDLWDLPIDEACEEAVAKVVAVRVRRTRAMIAAERARGQAVTAREYDGSDLVSYDRRSNDAAESATEAQAPSDEPVTYTESSEEPPDADPTPGYEHVRTTTGPTGFRVSHYRPVDDAPAATSAVPSRSAARIVPRAASSSSAAQTAAMPVAGLASMVRAVHAGRDAALNDLIGGVPGDAGGIDASLAQLAPDGTAQLPAAFGVTTTSSPTAALIAPVAPPAPVTIHAVLARMQEITPHLAPEEMATAQRIAASLPAEKRGLLMAKLVAVPVAQAVAIVKDILATHAAHGHPMR